MTIKNTLADLFGKSPIRPLQEHMEVSASAADELALFFKTVIKQDWAKAEAIYNNIRTIENNADQLKKDLRLHLPKSLFLPVARGDLLGLLTTQDKIANAAKDIAGLCLGRKMKLPEEMQSPLLEFVDTALANVHQALKAIEELDSLLESGFRGREVDLVEHMVDELNRLERMADDQEVGIRAKLFEREGELPPVDVMFLYRIIETIGDLADRAQKVGNRLLLLLAH